MGSFRKDSPYISLKNYAKGNVRQASISYLTTNAFVNMFFSIKENVPPKLAFVSLKYLNFCSGAFVERDWALSFVVPGVVTMAFGLAVWLLILPTPANVSNEGPSKT